ncbi:hypothetical protein [Hyphomonas sp.]|uniref:hypothetical protein n=1 Tax=Hyphomonas sp. TaxID=87 RepID=UPI003F7179ED|tara:strand:- start:184 stop:363 length:180 start_codon:yes stop_codon:yes gene_type:complete
MSSTEQTAADVLIANHFASLAESDVARFSAIGLPDFMQGRPVGQVRDEQLAAAPETKTI